MVENKYKWPFWDYPNGPNNSRNINTKLTGNKILKNCQKKPKLPKNGPKLLKNGPNWQFFLTHNQICCYIIYLDNILYKKLTYYFFPKNAIMGTLCNEQQTDKDPI